MSTIASIGVTSPTSLAQSINASAVQSGARAQSTEAPAASSAPPGVGASSPSDLARSLASSTGQSVGGLLNVVA